MSIAGGSGSETTPMGAESFLDPEIAATDPNELPEVTLDRTRRLLMRSRETLDTASKQLNRHHEDDTAEHSSSLS